MWLGRPAGRPYDGVIECGIWYGRNLVGASGRTPVRRQNRMRNLVGASLHLSHSRVATRLSACKHRTPVRRRNRMRNLVRANICMGAENTDLVGA
ncbi:MAG: hypothetical protein AB9907_17980 [Flexilinea sp.]